MAQKRHILILFIMFTILDISLYNIRFLRCLKKIVFIKGGSQVRILGQGGTIKWPPIDEITWNFACRGLLRVHIEFWSSWGHTASMEVKPICLTSGIFWVSNMYTQHPNKIIIKIWPHLWHAGVSHVFSWDPGVSEHPEVRGQF